MSDATIDPVYSEVTAPIEERRQNTRLRMTEIVYLNMDFENGGILLDVSASGLGFQLAGPLAKGKQISFKLSAEVIEDAEILAEVAWLDDDRKRGGLRFVQLPEKVRARIHRWAGVPAMPAAMPPDPLIPAVAKSTAPRREPKSDPIGRSLLTEMNPYSLTREAQPAGASKIAGSIRALDDLPNPMRANSSYCSALLSSPEPARGRQLAGAVLVLILLAAGVFVFRNKRQVGASLIHFGESLSGEYAQPVAPAPQSVTRPSNPTAPGPPEFAATDVPESDVSSRAGSESTTASASATTTPKAEEDTQPALPAARQPDSGPVTAAQELKDQQTKAPAEARHLNASQFEHTAPTDKSSVRSSDDSAREDDGHTELALAQQYLRGGGVPQDRDIAAHLLWVAVGEGNPQAELELADLYLRTDGVPAKNCAQARILLSASSNGGNLEAAQQLAKLRDYGCR